MRTRLLSRLIVIFSVLQAGSAFAERNMALAPLADGREWYELRGGLRHSFIKFSQGKTARVAFLGGSITQNPGWQRRVAEYLQTRFPDTEFDFVNAGISSTGSTPGAFRLENDVLSRATVDLLFEEAAVNDYHNGRSVIEQVRGMEGIVRHARQSNPHMDIVVMHFAQPPYTADYAAGRTPTVIQSHEKVAAHYGIPTINLAREVHDRLAAGQFDWDKDFVNLHPSPFGQNLYAESIRRLLEKAWSEGHVSGQVKVTPYDLPQPIDPACYAGGQYVSIETAVNLEGFAIQPNCRPQNGGQFRQGFVDVPMLVGTRPGDSFEFEFTGRGVGIFVAAGPDAGIIEYRIDSGPVRQVDTFTRWSRGLNLPWAYILDGDLQPGRHQIRLVISHEKNAKSRGHALRICHLLVNRHP